MRTLPAAIVALAIQALSVSAAEAVRPLPKIDVDAVCDRFKSGGIGAINACIVRNQSGYQYLQFIWPRVTAPLFTACEAVTSKPENRLYGYDLWADCISARIAKEDLDDFQTNRRKFQP